MTPSPGVHIECLHNPIAYTTAQIERACAVTASLDRGPFVLTIPPLYDCDTILGEGACDYCTWLRESA